MGTSRRISLLLACGITQAVAGSVGYPGLDRFGRVLDLHYQEANTSSSMPTVHRYQYGYDLAGNRTHCRVAQAPDAGTNGASHDNDRSWLYAYDALNRLVDAKLGHLTDSNTSIASSSPTPADIHWYLDNLGNWSGDITKSR